MPGRFQLGKLHKPISEYFIKISLDYLFIICELLCLCYVFKRGYPNFLGGRWVWWWYIPVIPTLRIQRQEDCEFKVNWLLGLKYPPPSQANKQKTPLCTTVLIAHLSLAEAQSPTWYQNHECKAPLGRKDVASGLGAGSRLPAQSQLQKHCPDSRNTITLGCGAQQKREASAQGLWEEKSGL